MSDLRGVKEGDAIWVVRRGDGREETVTRVGRLWVYTARVSAYRMDSGQKQGDDWCVAYRSRGEYEEKNRRYNAWMAASRRVRRILDGRAGVPHIEFCDELLALLDKHYPEETRT